MTNPTEGDQPKSDQQCAAMSVMLTAKDVSKSIAFYRDVLGFTLKEVWPDEGNAQWCSLSLGTQSLMLGAAPEEGAVCSDAGDEHGEFSKTLYASWRDNKPGAGVVTYLAVDDVDAFYETVKSKGALPRYSPKTQFYGIRDFAVLDPDGYCLIFYAIATLQSCGSCGMPLTKAVPGQMYCEHCTDDAGKLRSWDEVFEGTVTGYFMGMQKMERAEAEVAAKEHLTKMPAWVMQAG